MHWMDLYWLILKKKKKKLHEICYVAHIIFFHAHLYNQYIYIYIYIYSSIHPDPSCIQHLENLLAAVSLLKFETPLLKIYLSKYKLCLKCSAFGYKSRVFHSDLSLELLTSTLFCFLPFSSFFSFPITFLLIQRICVI